MYLALGILIALGFSVIIAMFREQKAPIYADLYKPTFTKEEFRQLLKEIKDLPTNTKVPEPILHKNPEKVKETKPPITPMEDIKDINIRIINLTRKAKEVYNKSYEPDQRVMADREFKDLMLQITEDFRLIDAQSPREETKPITTKKTVIS